MIPTKTGRGRPKGTGLNDAAQLRAIAGLIAADPELRPTTAIKSLGISDPSVIRRLRDKYSAAESSLIAEIAPQLPFEAPASLRVPSAPSRSPASQGAKLSLVPQSPAPVTTAPAVPAQTAAAPTLSVVPDAPAPTAAIETAPATTLSAVTVPPAAVPAANENVSAVSAGPRRVTPAPRTFVQPELVSEPAAPRREKVRHFALPSETALSDLAGIGLSLYALSVEAQVAVSAHLFRWPPLAGVIQSQVAFTEVAVAMSTAFLTSPILGSGQTK